VATVTGIADAYVERFAALDPVGSVRMTGVAGDETALTDYSPEGVAAMAELLGSTGSALRKARPADEAERLGALYLSEQVGGALGLIEAGERECQLSTLVGPPAAVRLAFDAMERSGDEGWTATAERLARVPAALEGYQVTLQRGLAGGLTASRRVAVAVADQCTVWATDGGGWFASLARQYGDGRLRSRLDAGAVAAAGAYGSLATWLRQVYVPAARESDAVGHERYGLWARAMLGTGLDLDEAEAWGWGELARLEAEKAVESDRIRPGARFEEARRVLLDDPARAVDGVEAYRAWLQEVTDEAIESLDGTHVDIAPALRRCEVRIPPEGSAAAPYYTPPSEDLGRPGCTWFPTLGQTRFPTWDKVSTAYHEAVPGHHLQFAASRAGALTRAQRVGFQTAHGEGWALYAERLMDELGRFTTPDTRLGFLCLQAFRAARVVVDIGLHTGRVVPAGHAGAGHPWTYEAAVGFVERAGGMSRAFAESEVLRYLSWPAQATAYKLGERVWLDGRDAARRAAGPAFDLRSWHGRALALGPLGLGDLARELALLGS